MIACIQKNPGRYDVVRLRDGEEVALVGSILTAGIARRVGGACYSTYADGRHINGAGTHRECLEAILAAHGENPMHCEGHSFRRAELKRLWWERNPLADRRPALAELL